MRRRDFISLLGSAATAWPLGAHAQRARMKRVAVLIGFAESDPQWHTRFTAFQAALRELGWTDGRNLVITSRWTSTDPDPSAFAAELVAESPDVIFTCPHTATVAVHRRTSIIPIIA